VSTGPSSRPPSPHPAGSMPVSPITLSGISSFCSAARGAGTDPRPLGIRRDGMVSGALQRSHPGGRRGRDELRPAPASDDPVRSRRALAADARFSDSGDEARGDPPSTMGSSGPSYPPSTRRNRMTIGSSAPSTSSTVPSSPAPCARRPPMRFTGRTTSIPMESKTGKTTARRSKTPGRRMRIGMTSAMPAVPAPRS